MLHPHLANTALLFIKCVKKKKPLNAAIRHNRFQILIEANLPCRDSNAKFFGKGHSTNDGEDCISFSVATTGFDRRCSHIVGGLGDSYTSEFARADPRYISTPEFGSRFTRSAT